MSKRDREFTKAEIKAGLMVISSMVVFLGFFAVVNGWRPAEPHKVFTVNFTDTAGLHPGSQVRFGGTLVGKVTALDFSPEDQSKIRVSLEVAADIPINEKSAAFITQVTLTSEPHVEIGTGEKEAKLLADGAEIPATVGGLFGAIAGVAGGLNQALEDLQTLMGAPDSESGAEQATAATADSTGTDTMVASVDTAATAEELVTVADLLRSVDSAVQDANDIVLDLRSIVNDRNADLDGVLGKVDEIGATAKDLLTDVHGVVKDNRENIGVTVGNVKDLTGKASEISKQLSERFDTLADALQATLDNAKTASGDAQGLVKGSRPEIEDMIADLREMVRYLKQFSRTISEQPQAVIRGEQEQGRKATN